MTRTGRRMILTLTAAMSGGLLIAFLVSSRAQGRRSLDFAREDTLTLARWISDHPADWHAASALSANALDSDAPRRFDLWREAYAHAARLAPHRSNTTTAFIRGGLFHWYELPPADRKLVLDKAAPLLRDPVTFTAMHKPLWDLTHDFTYLRRNAPDTEKAKTWLREIAVTHGLFADYRELRSQLPRKPVGIDMPQTWSGTCGRNEICKSAVKGISGQTIELHLQNAQSDGVPPYVEIYVGDVMAAEGPVVNEETFRIKAPHAGLHRVEVRLANPWTRNRIQRRVRLS